MALGPNLPCCLYLYVIGKESFIGTWSWLFIYILSIHGYFIDIHLVFTTMVELSG